MKNMIRLFVLKSLWYKGNNYQSSRSCNVTKHTMTVVCTYQCYYVYLGIQVFNTKRSLIMSALYYLPHNSRVSIELFRATGSPCFQ